MAVKRPYKGAYVSFLTGPVLVYEGVSHFRNVALLLLLPNSQTKILNMLLILETYQIMGGAYRDDGLKTKILIAPLDQFLSL